MNPNANTFRVRFTNFDYFSQETFATLDAALVYAKSKCFDVGIYNGEKLVASWSYIGGFRSY